MAYGKIKVAKNANFCRKLLRNIKMVKLKLQKMLIFAENFSVILQSAIVFGWRNISIQKYPQDFGWCGCLSSATEYQHIEGG